MLDNAVIVLRNLSITYKSDTTAITKAQLDTTIDEKFNSLRALLSRQNNDKSDKGKSGNVYGNDGAGKKGNLKRKWNPPYCADCGSSVHRRGDAECNNKSFETKKRMKLAAEAKKNDDSEQGNNDWNQFFPTGSNRKGN